MKSIAMLFASAFIALSSATVQAQNYYVCDTGDDSNSGTSVNEPVKSHPKAMEIFKKMNAGDSLLFCRGGVFPVNKSYRIYNYNCQADNVCTIADYGNPASQKPLLVVNDSIGLDFEDGGSANHDGGYLVKNISITAKTLGSGKGIQVFNEVDDLTIDNVTLNGLHIGIQLAGTNALEPGANGHNERIVIKNSEITNNNGHGWLGGCSECSIINNHFENNGYEKSILNHNLYFYSTSKYKPETNVLIEGNTLYKSAIVNGECGGVSLVVHGLVDNLTITNNVVKEDVGSVSEFCWGISVDPGYGTEEAFHNLKIIGNQLLNVGNVAIGCASCDGVLIEDNIIIDEASVLKAGIRVPVRKEDSVKSNNVVIKNNSVMLSRTDGVGVSIGGENIFKVSANEIRQVENSTKQCIERKGANTDTDVSSNTCSAGSKPKLTNVETGKVIDTTDVSAVTSIKRGSSQGAANDATQNQAPIMNINNRAGYDIQSKTKAANVSADANISLKTAEQSTSIEQVSTIEKATPVVTTRDVRAARSIQSTDVDYQSCRAHARGKCLLM